MRSKGRAGAGSSYPTRERSDGRGQGIDESGAASPVCHDAPEIGWGDLAVPWVRKAWP